VRQYWGSAAPEEETAAADETFTMLFKTVRTFRGNSFLSAKKDTRSGWRRTVNMDPDLITGEGLGFRLVAAVQKEKKVKPIQGKKSAKTSQSRGDWKPLSGKLASLARRLVGGEDLNGFPIPPATVEKAGSLIAELRRVLDEYDLRVLEAAEDERKAANG
jgi:hypothetical protein